MTKYILNHEQFGNEAVISVNYLRNRLFTTSCSNNKMTPHEMFSANKPSLAGIRVFGSKAYVHIPKKKKKNGAENLPTDQSKPYRLFMGRVNSTKCFSKSQLV